MLYPKLTIVADENHTLFRNGLKALFYDKLKYRPKTIFLKNTSDIAAIGFYDITFQMLNKLEGHAFYIFTFTEEDYRNATPLVFGEGFVCSVWRCTEGAGLQEGLVYNELRFVSESQVEGWGQLEGEPEPELFFMTTYSIDGETITITEDSESFTASLNETFTGLVTNIDNEGECIFIKQ